MFEEFKKFVMRGNVMDLAVGVIIGASFGTIVSSLTDDIIMPIVGAVFGGFDFTEYFIPLADGVTASTLEAARDQGAVLAYGSFITAIINFLILAWIIFLMIRFVNRLMTRPEEQPASPPPPTKDQQLLMEIRDLLAGPGARTAAKE